MADRIERFLASISTQVCSQRCHIWGAIYGAYTATFSYRSAAGVPLESEAALCLRRGRV